MTGAPLTLAEFEREAANNMATTRQYDDVGETFTSSDMLARGLRPLLLRLLAGERERVAAEMAEHYEGDFTAGLVVEDIRAMGDPT